MAVASAEKRLRATDHCELPMAPQGTCIPCADNARVWWVKGSTGWYRVNADTGECTCKGYEYRRNCRHGDDLREVLEIQRSLQAVSPITTARAISRATGEKVTPQVAELSQDELKAIFA